MAVSGLWFSACPTGKKLFEDTAGKGIQSKEFDLWASICPLSPILKKCVAPKKDVDNGKSLVYLIGRIPAPRIDFMRSNPADDYLCARFGHPSDAECTLMPLCEAEAGKKVKVAYVHGERELCARMAALGIYPGVELRLLCSGNFRVNGCVLSLSRDISGRILVFPSP